MANDNIKILEFLDIEDNDIELLNIETKDSTKTIYIQKKPRPMYCSQCGTRMHQKDSYWRKANHSILQDGFRVVIQARQCRWYCTDPECGFRYTDEFIFLRKGKHNTTTQDILILEALRDWDTSIARVAERFDVSDTYVFSLMDRYLDMHRLTLPEILSVDEVFLNIASDSKYALILHDFMTGEPVDMVESRKSDTTEKYFTDIPLDERRNVKYLITDMYKPYLNYINKYFPNAVGIVDSFHVASSLEQKLLQHLRQLHRKYESADKDRHIEAGGSPDEQFPSSNETYMLKKFQFLILKNQSNMVYHEKKRYDRKLKCYMNTRDYENLLFSIEPDLELIRNLKEKYANFNAKSYDSSDAAAAALDRLIETYSKSHFDMFVKFSATLKAYREEIANSFITVSKAGRYGDETSRRLSNGPIEGLNRFIKDMKRNARGFKNYEHIRTRFLFSRRSRENAPILATPRELPSVDAEHSRKRGPYKKHK